MAKSQALVVKASSEVAKVDSQQTLKATKALLGHLAKSTKEAAASSDKKNLLAEADSDGEDSLLDETPIWLTLTTKRHILKQARLQPVKIPIPHSLHSSDHASICLITAAPQRAYKDLLSSEDFPQDLAKRITRVIDANKLAAKFGQFEAQRKLRAEHDIFLGDTRIINRLPKILGKTFYRSTQKRPIPVILQSKEKKQSKGSKKKDKDEKDLNIGLPKDIAREIQKAMDCALVNLAPSTNTAIKVANASWSADQVAENVSAVVNSLIEHWVEGNWSNVRTISIKGPQTASLPIYETDELWLNEKSVVANDDPRANVGKKRKGADEEEDVKEEEVVEEKEVKKSKKARKAVPESNDNKLDGQIAERKARLRQAKAKAAKA